MFASFSTCFTSLLLTLFHHIYINLSSFFSDSLSLSLFLHLSPLFLFSRYSSISLSTSTSKLLISDVYRGFHGSAVKLHSGISFSREHVHDMACRKPFCSVILSGTISPMRFDDRGPSNTRSGAVPVPWGIRQFRLSRSLSLRSLSVIRSTRRIYRARCRRAQTRNSDRAT